MPNKTPTEVQNQAPIYVETLLTLKEAAPRIKCSVVTLRRLIRAGQIGYKRCGKRYFLTHMHLRNYLDRIDVPPNVISDSKNIQNFCHENDGCE